MPVHPFDRTHYEPAFARRLRPFPGGGRLALHVIVNVEDWDVAAPMPRTALPAPGVACVPDVPNYAWYQYGMRVGIWRLMDVLAEFRIRATLSINGSVCERYPQIVERARAARWEPMGHGFVQHTMTSVEDEADVIGRTLDTIEHTFGTRPRGWLGPAMVESAQTLDLLADAGLTYCCDWGPADDRPYPLRTRSGTMIAVPYPIETNDLVIFAIEKHSANELYLRTRAAFDVLYAESAQSPTVLSIALHPYLTGVPHRIDALRRVLGEMCARPGVVAMTAGELADWYAQAATPTLAAR
jgi:allantoinase